MGPCAGGLGDLRVIGRIGPYEAAKRGLAGLVSGRLPGSQDLRENPLEQVQSIQSDSSLRQADGGLVERGRPIGLRHVDPDADHGLAVGLFDEHAGELPVVEQHIIGVFDRDAAWRKISERIDDGGGEVGTALRVGRGWQAHAECQTVVASVGPDIATLAAAAGLTLGNHQGTDAQGPGVILSGCALGQYPPGAQVRRVGDEGVDAVAPLLCVHDTSSPTSRLRA